MKTVTYDPEQWQLVPKNPDRIMVNASWDCAGSVRYPDGHQEYIAIAYQAMLAAAPIPAPSQQDALWEKAYLEAGHGTEVMNLYLKLCEENGVVPFDRSATPIPPSQDRKDLVLVPRELIDAAKNLIAVKGRHHTELAYKQLCQALVNCEGSKP